MLGANQSYGQLLSTCDPGVPNFVVDLSGNADSAWVSSAVKRKDNCCTTSFPDRCITFLLTLDTGAQGFKFDIASGAKPPGALFYQIDNCDSIYQVGDPICLPGPGPYEISFCKPGANLNTYGITSIAKPEASPPTVVSDGCSAQIFAKNFIESSITWTSTPVDATHNSYLDCTSGCDTVNVAIDSGDSPPPFIDYAVSGVPEGGCDGDTVTLTIRVFFVTDKFVEILPKDPVICFGGTTASVTANPNGGAAPYTYLWSTGETTQSINVGVGTYSVVMYDSTDCPPVFDTVVVTANPSPISADAGGPYSSCINNPNVQLNGSVVIAEGGTWTGGAGTFDPSPDSLNAIYIPDASELVAGTVINLTLTTTGNGICPPSVDNTTITITASPTVDAGGPYTSCANNSQVLLAGSVTVAGGGRWSSTGTGTFAPNDSSLNATYTPSAADITAGSVDITLTSIQNGGCNPVDQTVTLTISAAPVVDAGSPATVCANNADVVLSGSVTGPTTTGEWSTSGDGTFSNITDLNATYTPGTNDISNGSVTLTLESTNNGSCNPVTSDVIITITPAPVVDAGLPLSVCANNPPANINGTVTIGGVAHTGEWSTSGDGTFGNISNLSTTYTPGTNDISNGTVTLTLESTNNGTCIAVQDQVVLTITPAPTVDAGLPQTICENSPTVNLSGSITVATGATWSGGGGNLYNPNANSLTPVYTASGTDITNGTVTLFLTTTGNGACQAVQDSVTITIDNAPAVSAGNDDTLCADVTSVNLNGSVTAPFTSTWSTAGDGTFTDASDPLTTYNPGPNDISGGSVVLTITSNAGASTCNAVSDFVTLNFQAVPTVSAGNDEIVCASSPEVTLNGVVNNASGGIWTNGGGTYNSSDTDLGAIYTPNATEITNELATLILTTTGNGVCAAVADTVNITYTPGPVAAAGNDQFQCSNNVSIALAGNVTNATGGVWYSAFGGPPTGGTFLPNANMVNGDTVFYTPSATEISFFITELILETTGNGVCPADRDTVLITFTPSPVADAGNDVDVCENNQLATVTGAVGGGASPTWSGGNGTYNPNTTTAAITYLPTAAEIANGFVDLILEASRSTCLSDFDTMRITISPAPVVDAGSPQSVCANNADITLVGSVTGATTTGGWTTAGDGVFSDTADLNAIYTPGPNDISSGSVILTLESTNNGSCNPVSDNVTMTITPAPTVDAGTPISICANNASAVLGGTVSAEATGGTWIGGNGTFTPSRNVLAPTYIPDATEISNGSVELILESTGNGTCLPVQDTLLITITPAPVVDAGPDTTVCIDNPSVQLQGTVSAEATGGTWTGGNGTYNPNANDLNAIYTPTATELANGSVTLTLISTGNGNCNPESATMTISISQPPTVSAGSDQDVCGDLSDVSLNGSVTVATGGVWSTTNGTGTFTPNDSTLTATYTPTTADTTLGSITLTLTTTGNGGCNSRSEDMIINFVPAPTINAGPDQQVCTNAFPIQLAASGSPGTWSGGSGTFSPNANALDATYQPTGAEIANGFIDLTYTTTATTFCPSISSTVQIIFPAGPTAFAGNDTTVCGSTTDFTLSGQVTNSGGGVWTTLGTGTFNNANNLGAVYTYSATDKTNGSVALVLTNTSTGICDPETDTIVITILEEIIASAGSDLTACADASGIALAGSVTGATGGIWSTSGTGTFTPSDTALFGSYVPSDADTTAGSVVLTLTSTGNSGCPADDDNITLTLTPAPTVNAGPDTVTTCADEGGVVLNGTITVASGGTWSSSGTGVFTPSASNLSTTYIPSDADTANGFVTLVLETTGNGTCNPVRDTLVIEITPAPFVNAGNDQVVCADNLQVNLSGRVNNAGGGTWQTSGTGTFTPNANDLNAVYNMSSADSAAGLVVLTLESTGNGTCNTYDDQLNITITPAPTVDAGSDLFVCSNEDSISLIGNVTIASGGTWSSPNGGGSFTAVNSLNTTYLPVPADTVLGTIQLVLTSTGNGTCNAVSETINVTFNPQPNVDAGNDTSICSDLNTFQLNANFSNASGIVWSSSGTGSFSPSTTDPNATYQSSQADSAAGSVNITLTSTGNNGCPADTDIKILTLTPGVIVTAGGDLTVCADTLQIPLVGGVTNATGGVWTTTGTGTFLDSSDLNTSYIPSAFDTAAGSVLLTLTSTGNGGCFARSDNITITIDPAPVVFAGPDQSICAGDATISLLGQVTNATGGTWSTNGNGNFIPDAINLSSNYTIDPADTTAGTISIFLTSTGNGLCKAVVDTMILTFDPVVNVSAGGDTSICEDVTTLGLAGSLSNAISSTWTTSGSGTFSPNASDLNAIYSPTQADIDSGTIILTLNSTSGSACFNEASSINVTFTPPPTVDAGLNDTLCISSPVASLNGSFTTATGATWSTASGQGTFSPSNTDMNATFTPSATQLNTGSVIITLSTTGNGTCNVRTDQVQITFQELPEASAGLDQIVCSDNPGISINGSVLNSGGGTWTTSGTGTFDPDVDSLTGQYLYSLQDELNGSVSLYLTTTDNGVCPADQDTIDLTITPAPTVAAVSSSNCADINGVQLTGNVTISTGLVWSSSGTGTFSPNTTNNVVDFTPSAADIIAGTVTIYLTSTGNGNCNAVVDSSIVLVLSDIPSAEAGQNKIVCADQDTIALSGQITVATSAVWTSSGGGTFIPNANDLGASYLPTALDKSNGTVKLYLTTDDPLICNQVSDSLTITITPAPTIDAGAEQSICENRDTITVNATVTVATGVTWSTVSGSGTFASPGTLSSEYYFSAGDKAADSVYLIATSTGNGLCNAVQDSMLLILTPGTEVDGGADLFLCDDVDSIFISRTINVASGAIWSTNGGGSILPGTAANPILYIADSADKANGQVSVFSVTTGNGSCFAARDTINLFFFLEPTSNITLPNLCTADDSIPLIGDTTNASSLLWSSNGTGTYTPNTTTLNVSYIRSLADSIAGTATVYLTAIGDTACENAIDSIVLNLSPPPAATAGSDVLVCADTAGIQLTGLVTDATGGGWTSTGTGTFNPDTSDLNAIYIPSDADTANGSVTILLETTGNAGCDPDIDSLEITITPAPTVDAGPAIVCANNPTVQLNGSVTTATGAQWSTAGDGTFDNVNLLNAVYTVGVNDISNGTVTLTLTTTGNGDCKEYTDDIIINIANAPQATAGSDTTVCRDNTEITVNGNFTNATGGAWTTLGSGSFNDTTLASPIYTFSTQDILDDSVILVFETTGNGSCLPDYDSILVNYSEIPTVSTGGDTVCNNNAVFNLNGALTIATSATWSNPGSTGNFGNTTNLSTTYTPSPADIASGSVVLVLTSDPINGCNAYTDTLNLFLTPGPSADAGNVQDVCADTSFVQLTGLVGGAAGGGAWTTNGDGVFLPDTNDLSAQYVPGVNDTTNGTVTIYLTTINNGNCLAVMDSTTLNISPAPVLISSNDQTVCADTAGIDLSSSFQNATGVIWSLVNPASGNFSPNNTSQNTTYLPSNTDTANGFVQLIVETDGVGNCKVVRDTIDLTITPAPTLNPGGSPLCSDDPIIPLNATVTVATSVAWTSTGSGFFSPNNLSLTSNYVRSSADSAAGSVILIATTTGMGSCKAISDSIEVFLIPAPTAHAGSDVTICDAETVVPIAGTVNNATGGTWTTDGNGTFDNVNGLTTNYNVDPQDVLDSVITIYLTSTGNNGCNPAVDSIILTIVSPSPEAQAGNDLTVCADAPFVQLSGNVLGATGGTWTSSGTGTFSPSANILSAQYIPSVADTSAGNITLSLATTGNGICNPDIDSLTLTFTTVPLIDAGPPVDACTDNPTVTLAGQDAGNAIFWTTSGSGIFSDSTSATSTYTASALDILDSVITLTLSTTGAGGCQIVTDQTTLSFNPAPQVDPGLDLTICADQASVTLNGSVTNTGGGIWSTSGTGTFADDTILNTTYSPSLADTTAGFVFLTLTSTGEGLGCNTRQDSILLTINDGVSVFAGPDQLICRNESLVQLTGTVTNALSGVWSTSLGNGLFSPAANGLTSNYIIFPADTSFDTIPIFFTTTGNGGCLAKQDTMLVLFVPNPVADAGQNVTVCEDAPDVTLTGNVTVTGKGQWSTTGTGVFLPNDSSLNATYQPSALDITNGGVNISLTSTDNGQCNPASDFISVSILAAPILDAGQDQTVCFVETEVTMNPTISNVNNVYWTTSGDGFFVDSTVNAARYFFGNNDKNSGSVELILFSNDQGQCANTSDTVVITVLPEITVDAGAPQTVCADLDFISLNGTFANAPGVTWTTTGNGLFTPGNTSNTVDYFFDTLDLIAGTIGMTLTTDSSVCPSVSSGINITITPAPVIDVGLDQDVCASEDSVSLNALFSTATGVIWSSSGTGSFAPNITNPNAVYLPSAADVNLGTVLISAFSTGNGTCNSVSDDLLLTFRNDPTVNAGPDQFVCSDINVVPLNGNFQNANGILWTFTGTGFILPDPTSQTPFYRPSTADTVAGTVSMILTTTGNEGCPPAIDTMDIDFQPAPIVTTGDVDACADAAGVLLNGNVVNSPGVLWLSNGTGVFAPSSSELAPTYIPSSADFATGFITLTISSDGSGVCAERTDEATILITPLPFADAGLDKVVCRDDTAVLVPFIESGNAYEWYNIDSTLIGQGPIQTVNVPTNSSYIVRVIDINGCDQFDTVNVDVVDPPVFNMIDEICFEDGFILNSNPSFTDTLGTLQWYREDSLLDGQILESVQIANDGNYIITYNYESCNRQDTTLVHPLPVLNAEDVFACEGDTFSVSVDFYPNADYQWFNSGVGFGPDTSSVVIDNVSDSTFFQVRVEDSLGCVNRDTLLFIPVPPPIMTLDTTPGCVGELVMLDAGPLNAFPDTTVERYVWSLDGEVIEDSTDIIFVSEEGLYTVLYSVGGCRARDTGEVFFNLPPETDNIESDEWCSQIDPFITLDAGPGERFYWYYTGDSSQTSNIDDFGYFSFEVINEFGCITVDSIFLSEVCPPQLFVPNAFSPNNDGLDDLFLLFGKNFAGLDFKIYNRWGEVIFFTDNPEEVWDGTFRGEPMPVGVYPWTAEYKGTFPGQEGPFRLKGSVTLIR